MYDKLVAKVNDNGFILKSKYDIDKSDLEQKFSDAEKKIPDTGGLIINTDYNAKITEIESIIPSVSGLVTSTTLTAVENKILDVSNLVKKTDYDAKNIRYLI